MATGSEIQAAELLSRGEPRDLIVQVRQVTDITPLAADAMRAVAESEFAVPARERTKQTAIIVAGVVPGVLVALGLISWFLWNVGTATHWGGRTAEVAMGVLGFVVAPSLAYGTIKLARRFLK